uniref:Uncharacterized protein n=1 Tax=Catagonus wagneri TaxID=51154 RepID=A0A8C3X0P2_9CETA
MISGRNLASLSSRPSDLVHFSSQALTGAVSTIKFFLIEAFLGHHFEAVELEGSDPEPGDLFLFRLMCPTGRWCGAHVGVYCGHGEIIHFEGEYAAALTTQRWSAASAKPWTRTLRPITPRSATACTLQCNCSVQGPAWTSDKQTRILLVR